ncbi:MAG TPA: DUF932 domain-containing protein [Pseudonocardiaceae bacterium]|nr:DUF932 domain-containing protein [Pseudonocardiaceae bacterium]
MSSQIAANQYANRPPDERFESIEALIADAASERQLSREKAYNIKDLAAVAIRQDERQPDSPHALMLQSPKNRAHFSHWSFGQLARTVSAPAAYLRTLSPDTAARCINEGIAATPAGTDVNVLVRQDAPAVGDTPPVLTVRACTSDTYGRLWDQKLYEGFRDLVIAHDPSWKNGIPTWSGEKAGFYRGDRDSFAISVNGGSIVEDPSAPQGQGEMYRGIILRNSEVGAAKVRIYSFFLRAICGNHMLWGLQQDQTFSRRHVGSGDNVLRDTLRELSNIAYRFTRQSAAQDQAIIKTLIDNEIATTKQGVIDELRKVGYTAEQAAAAYATCEATENASPRSYWGLAQGTTRNSQQMCDGHMDERLTLDQLAAALIVRGQKAHAAAVRV